MRCVLIHTRGLLHGLGGGMGGVAVVDGVKMVRQGGCSGEGEF